MPLLLNALKSKDNFSESALKKSKKKYILNLDIESFSWSHWDFWSSLIGLLALNNLKLFKLQIPWCCTPSLFGDRWLRAWSENGNVTPVTMPGERNPSGRAQKLGDAGRAPASDQSTIYAIAPEALWKVISKQDEITAILPPMHHQLQLLINTAALWLIVPLTQGSWTRGRCIFPSGSRDGGHDGLRSPSR